MYDMYPVWVTGDPVERRLLEVFFFFFCAVPWALSLARTSAYEIVDRCICVRITGNRPVPSCGARWRRGYGRCGVAWGEG